MAKVLGMGNALVDIITRISSDKVLDSFGLIKGSMTLVDLDTSNFIHAETAGMSKTKASGGSAANTIHGLAHLGIETGFVGSVGNDDLGRFFKKDMQINKIKPILFRTMNETGRAVALVSFDSERTFATFLGAAIDLTPEDITHDIFEDYDHFFMEGYLVQNKNLLEKALRLASEARLKIYLDLPSFNVVAENQSFLKSMIHEHVDVLFGNEEEIMALTEDTPEASAMEFQQDTQVVVVKMGAEGSICFSGGEKIRIGVRPSRPVDTTGAGDLYAAGFIFGQIKGHPLETCGKIGAILGGRIIEQEGAKMDESHWENIRREIRNLQA
jgi:sugar/nucleoside kinase (ribokinase family)